MAKTDYAAILLEAHTAAERAVFGLKDMDNAACGFAWVTISGNEMLARFCRAELKQMDLDIFNGKDPRTTKLARRTYGVKADKGWTFWKPGAAPGQGIAIHEIGARAFRDALARHGIRSDLGSRLD